MDGDLGGALSTLHGDLVRVGRMLASGGGDGVDEAWVEEVRRFVWGQIAALSTLAALAPTPPPSPLLPPLPRPKRGNRCVVCASLSPSRSAAALTGEERCYVHADPDERERARQRRKREAADVAGFLDKVGWPWPPPPTWRELWRENQRTYTRVSIPDPLMPVVPPWVRRRVLRPPPSPPSPGQQ